MNVQRTIRRRDEFHPINWNGNGIEIDGTWHHYFYCLILLMSYAEEKDTRVPCVLLLWPEYSTICWWYLCKFPILLTATNAYTNGVSDTRLSVFSLLHCIAFFCSIVSLWLHCIRTEQCRWFFFFFKTKNIYTCLHTIISLQFPLQLLLIENYGTTKLVRIWEKHVHTPKFCTSFSIY